MASQELIEFLRSVDEKYAQYAQLLHEGTFTNKGELSAADKSDLEALGVPKGAAGLIIRAAQGIGELLDNGTGSTGTVSPEMVRFAECAAATAGEEDENGRWLELPEGVFFLGLPNLGGCLYIREAYRRLADVLEDMLSEGKQHVVISGNPGLGKTWFAIWMLVRWLRKGDDVLWHTSSNRFFYYGNGTVSALSGDKADYVLRTKRELRYIVDGATPLVDLIVKQSMVAHSPDDSKYKEYLKINNAAGSPLYMPFWDEEELEIARLKMHPAVSRNQMNQMIARRGEVPRYVLVKGMDRQVDSWMAAAVQNLEWADIIMAVPGSARASHRIAAIHPTDWRTGNFVDYELKFLSVAVKDAVAARLSEVVTGGLANLMLLVNKSAHALAADLSSCIEESIVHALLKKGGKWPLRKCAPKYSRGPVASQKSTKKQANSSSISVSSLQAMSSKSDEEGIVRGSASPAGDQRESRDLAQGSELSDQSDITVGSSESGDSTGHREIEHLELPSLPVDYFAHAEELDRISDQDVYMQPRVSNFPAIDALVVLGGTAYLFQVTRNTSHKINVQLCKVLAHLPVHLEVKWVWVLPPHLCAAGRFNAREVPFLDETGIDEEKVQLVEKRLQAIKVQYKMPIKELIWRKQLSKVADEPVVAGEAQFGSEAEDTARSRKAAKGVSGKAGEQQQQTGSAPTGTCKSGKQRKRGSVRSTAAMLAQRCTDCSIVWRRAQVSLQRPAHLPSTPPLLHHRARAAPTPRLFFANCGLQRCII